MFYKMSQENEMQMVNDLDEQELSEQMFLAPSQSEEPQPREGQVASSSSEANEQSNRLQGEMERRSRSPEVDEMEGDEKEVADAEVEQTDGKGDEGASTASEEEESDIFSDSDEIDEDEMLDLDQWVQGEDADGHVRCLLLDMSGEPAFGVCVS